MFFGECEVVRDCVCVCVCNVHSCVCVRVHVHACMHECTHTTLVYTEDREVGGRFPYNTYSTILIAPEYAN